MSARGYMVVWVRYMSQTRKLHKCLNAALSYISGEVPLHLLYPDRLMRGQYSQGNVALDSSDIVLFEFHSERSRHDTIIWHLVSHPASRIYSGTTAAAPLMIRSCQTVHNYCCDNFYKLFFSRPNFEVTSQTTVHIFYVNLSATTSHDIILMVLGWWFYVLYGTGGNGEYKSLGRPNTAIIKERPIYWGLS